MIKNTLFSSGQVVTLAIGQTYTVKDNEVFLNRTLYRKCDLEIALSNVYPTNQAGFIGVGVKKRNTLSNLPADLVHFEEWQVDGVTQPSLGDCIDNVNTAIYCSETATGGGGGDPEEVDYSRVILKIAGMAVNKRSNTNYTAIQVGDLIDGEYPFGSGRYIKAKVIALPHTTEGNLEIYSDDSI